ncbi:hypothetical protein TTHERM_000675818 (macronuclear) [Tetrahymena thermophila SB210]|uniref:Uncharacterized protein n=1 Tax=Tetrahymena thermophila (strain SB210) TaxID=312017 RepID=W7XIF3_TETTS|nr:hypothetical protein TTHERM_000675818 [Tetrahymena thermophila SB210]EWS74591.1 hypothetical protein TTHERM_000675818 [Tetrahymena thermophila SB210]|eukprot:XP_012652892.1 hypothetical protein TTHERM_000675818 [Tetrahymena thermophila SB210]
MQDNQNLFGMSSLKQQEFNNLSEQQKIQKALNYTRNLVFDSLDLEDQDLVFSDDLQSFTLQNIEVSPFPTESRKVMKYIETSLLQQFLDKNNFIEINNYSVIFVNIDDLSYHNFENILNLDHLFGNVEFKLKSSKIVTDKIQTFIIQGSTENLLLLDKLNYYTQPLNATQRGGKRLIFHSNQLSYCLTEMIEKSNFFDKKQFMKVNNVFRLNNFAPGDKKFKSHYDTPFADKSQGLYSKYTMLIYLTGNKEVQNEQPPLAIENISFKKISENSCIIFDQQLQHEGNAYFDNNKIFIRTELIYKIDGLNYNEKVAQMFNMACYMTKEIDQQQYSADLFNKCVKMRYNIPDEKEELKKVYLFKRNLDIVYVTDGNYYWFPLYVPLELIGTLIVLDYFSGKVYSLKNIKIQTKLIKNIDNSKNEEEIDKFIFDIVNQQNFEDEEITESRAQFLQDLEDYVPKTLCENFTFYQCGCGLLHKDDMTQAKQLFKIEKINAVKNLKNILNQNSVLIFDNLIKINLDEIKTELNSNNERNGLSSGKIIFSNQLNIQNSINFASCNCEQEIYEEDVMLFRTKKLNTFRLPQILFKMQTEGIKLSIDMFKNGFIYNSTDTFQQPYTNKDETYKNHKKKQKQYRKQQYGKYYKQYFPQQESDSSSENEESDNDDQNSYDEDQNSDESNYMIYSYNENKLDEESVNDKDSQESEQEDEPNRCNQKYPEKQKSKDRESVALKNQKKLVKKDYS